MILFLSAVVPFAFLAQAVEPKVEFEVVTIKPLERPMRSGLRGQGDPRTLNYPSAPLRFLIRQAYGVADYQIKAPAWIDTQYYDVVAKIPEGASPKQGPAMLQTMLAARLGLKTHRESQMEPAYALIVGKNGPKLTKFDAAARGSDGKPVPSMSFRPPGHFEYHGLTLPMVAQSLSMSLGRPVIDRTGIEGTFDIVMDVDPVDLEGMRKSAAALGLAPSSRENSAAPSIFTVIQEFGLKLESRKESVQHLIVDHVEKMPTEN